MTSGVRNAMCTIALSGFALLAPARIVAQDTTTTIATSDALRVPTRVALAALLADASKRNVLPPTLIAYKARVETEIAVLLRREEGTEVVTAVEQVASGLRWTRGGYYDQHVIGYRAQLSAGTVSMLSLFRTGWLTPVLYGNRLRVSRRASSDSARTGSARRDGLDTLPAVHPLASDRDAYYQFSGGDTVVTMRVDNRLIPIVHVRVRPRQDVRSPVLLFDGELDLDASRGALVRLRGNFVRLNTGRGSLASKLVTAVAFIEYENAEHRGEYWLPTKQRIELQATLPAFGDSRAVVRIASRFSQLDVNDTTLSIAALARADSNLVSWRRRLTFARSDSLDRYAEWRAAIGDITAGMHADDFRDLGPDRWRTFGAPRLDYTVPRGSDVFHFNRVEGAYTGFGVKVSLRDVAPGVVVRANAGWAWNEGTARGRLSIERTRGPWTTELRAGRSLDNTNDFRVPFDSGNTFGALFASQDPYDYVDRSSATLAAVRRVGGRAYLLRGEIGVADDHYRRATYLRSPFGGDAYRPNRGVDEGGYVRIAATVEWHPDVSAEFLRPGIGARLWYEHGAGTLSFQRLEARVVGRQLLGPLVVVGRADVGTVLGDRPPAQQLFELGAQQNLPGYRDKEFAGTRAAVLRGQVQYNTKYLQQPIRFRRIFLPAVAPSVSVGLQGGWTELPNAAARAAVLRLGTLRDSAGVLSAVSRATDGGRASVSAGMRFFGSSLFVGATRAVDHAAPWKFVVSFGQPW